MLIEFPKHEVALSSIVIAYPPLKDCHHIPINLRIEGSNDAVHWKTLKSSYQEDDIKKWPHVMHCAIDNTSDALAAEIVLERSNNSDVLDIAETNKHCFYSYIRILHLGKSYPTLSLLIHIYTQNSQRSRFFRWGAIEIFETWAGSNSNKI